MTTHFLAFIEKLIDFIKKPVVKRITLLFLGFTSTAWFLIRVIPKPSRATYPCMQASAPMMSAFVIYLITFFGSIKAFMVAKMHFSKAKYVYGALFLGIAFIGSVLFFFGNPVRLYAKTVNSLLVEPNKPVGEAKGIFPGRVVWAHNPKVANWNGKTGYWWEDQFNSQPETDKLLTNTLLSLTGQKTEAKAWNALFMHFNNVKKRGGKAYQQQEKIAIKINENNTDSHADTKEINALPQLVLSLLNSLINEASVPQKNITVFDASRFITNNIFDKCHAQFPEVRFVDNVGGDGRIKSEYAENAIPYSVDNGNLARGLATCVVEADYLINMALLKGHVGQGVTLCAKNYYGCTSIYSDWRKNSHSNFDQDRSGKPKYMTFTDFLGHKDLGQKTMLYLIDAIYGHKFVNGIPGFKLKMAPFDNNWPCSLLASQDPVAIDAVGTDIILNEWPDAPDLKFSDQYMIESALAENPPSGTHYDPERDGTGLKSLGVMEHWNNAEDRKYSRNLKTGNGIELIYKNLMPVQKHN